MKSLSDSVRKSIQADGSLQANQPNVFAGSVAKRLLFGWTFTGLVQCITRSKLETEMHKEISTSGKCLIATFPMVADLPLSRHWESNADNYRNNWVLRG